MAKEKEEPEALPPNTTEEQNTVTAGQRRINFIWEITQAIIALVVVVGNVWVAVYQALSPIVSSAHPDILSNALFLVIGFYFSRTNHQSIGGVGYKENMNDPYQGR